MFEELEYKIFTKEEKESFGYYDTAEIAVFIEKARNRIVCMMTLDITKRGAFCDSCNQRCAVGYVVWTHSDMRGQGLLSELARRFHADLDIDSSRVYIDPRETLSVDEAAFVWARGLRLTPGFQWDNTAKTTVNVRKTEEWIGRISQALGYDV